MSDDEPVEDITATEEASHGDEIEEQESDAKEVKLFGKWDFSSIEVRDISLEVSEVMLCLQWYSVSMWLLKC